MPDGRGQRVNGSAQLWPPPLPSPKEQIWHSYVVLLIVLGSQSASAKQFCQNQELRSSSAAASWENNIFTSQDEIGRNYGNDCLDCKRELLNLVYIKNEQRSHQKWKESSSSEHKHTKEVVWQKKEQQNRRKKTSKQNQGREQQPEEEGEQNLISGLLIAHNGWKMAKWQQWRRSVTLGKEHCHYHYQPIWGGSSGSKEDLVHITSNTVITTTKANHNHQSECISSSDAVVWSSDYGQKPPPPPPLTTPVLTWPHFAHHSLCCSAQTLPGDCNKNKQQQQQQIRDLESWACAWAQRVE